MYLLLIFLPLLGSVCAGFFGRYLGMRGASLITILFLLTTFLFSTIAFYEVALSGTPCSVKVLDWFSCEMLDASWSFYFDSLSVVMLIVITSVSSLVHIYSYSYMSEDPHLPRFMSYLSIFTFFMIMLVTSENLLLMFFGWEGVGLASYLLINFWFTRLSANKSSIKAMLLNRVGDFGLALGIMAIFSVFKTLSFPVIFSLVPSMVDSRICFLNNDFDALSVIALCLFVGAIGKSAQLGLHTWLPDAMEGPTPVSALIHAATMVTAGVFMIARCSPLFEFADTGLGVIALLGAMTCFFAATTAVVQNDLKRVIAYSTASQIGYMIFACGVSNYSAALFHLMNHAFFKALLFLGAGSVIHALSNQQDMRKMGGLVQQLPFTYSMMLIGSLSLTGFPFLTGFYSKDLILEVTFARYTINGNFAYWLGGLCVLLTSYYSFRLCFLTFFGESNASRKDIQKGHDAPLVMAIPLMLLAIGSIFLGYCGKDMMIGIGTDFWGNALFTLPENSNILESHYIPQTVKMIPFIFTITGIILAFFVSQHKTIRRVSYSFKISPIGLYLYKMLNKRWFFDKVYNDYLAGKALDFGYTVSFKGLDKGIFEILGPKGITLVLSKTTRESTQLQSGMIYHYAFVMIIGLTLFITVITLSDFLEMLIDTRLYLLFITLLVFSLIKIKDTTLSLRD